MKTFTYQTISNVPAWRYKEIIKYAEGPMQKINARWNLLKTGSANPFYQHEHYK